MRIVVVAILGSIGGLIVGGTLGLLTGIAWINIFKPSEFEGYASMMVAFVVTPFGAVMGGLIGAIWAGTAAYRARLRIERDTTDST
jgi:sodium--glutamate symport carrier gltS